MFKSKRARHHVVALHVGQKLEISHFDACLSEDTNDSLFNPMTPHSLSHPIVLQGQNLIGPLFGRQIEYRPALLFLKHLNEINMNKDNTDRLSN
jgi:hypothetical protein